MRTVPYRMKSDYAITGAEAAVKAAKSDGAAYSVMHVRKLLKLTSFN